MGSLTAVQLRNLKSAGRYSDGDGLMLIVRESGKASWIVRVQYNGRRRDIGIGAFPDLSLSKAREIAADVRRKSKAGIDIVTERKKEKEIVPTFRVAARQVHADHKAGWKNGKHQAQWISTLETMHFRSLAMIWSQISKARQSATFLRLSGLRSPKPRAVSGSASARCWIGLT